MRGLLFFAVLAALICQFLVLRQFGAAQMQREAKLEAEHSFRQAQRGMSISLRAVEDLALDAAIRPSLFAAVRAGDGDWLTKNLLTLPWRVEPTVMLVHSPSAGMTWSHGPLSEEALRNPLRLPGVERALEGAHSSGFFRLNGRLAAVSAAPIRPASQDLPAVGVIFIARYVDQEMLEVVSDVTGYSMALLSGGHYVASGPQSDKLKPSQLELWRDRQGVENCSQCPAGSYVAFGPILDSEGNRVGTLAVLRLSSGFALFSAFGRLVTVASLFLSVLLAAVIGIRIGAMVNRPLMASADTARSVAEGNLSARMETNGTGDAFDVFAQSFNAMADELSAAFTELEDQKAEISAQLDTFQALNEEMADYSVEVQTLSEQLQWQNSQLETLNERLRQMAHTDGLTGLINHRSFHDKLAEAFGIATRHGTPLSLVMIDVDHFKQFNDRHGHPGGDEALREVAALLKRLARETDTCARYGGEEFAVILPHTDIQGAVAFAERAREAAHKLKLFGTPITISLGVASLGPGIKTPGDLVAQADAALYDAKRSGRDRVCLATTHDRLSA
ncbi:MAG: diguanylate cyclase [Fimbriimonadia bacterium]